MERTHAIKLIKDYVMRLVCLDREQRVNPTRLFPVLDDAGLCYVLIASGWEGARWAQDLMLFVRLKDDKVLIESDYTYEGIGNFLLENGVLESDIILCRLRESQQMTKQEAA